MDPFEELERLAENATSTAPTDPTEEEISRWCALFNYSRQEAVILINAHRGDFTRIRIPEEHWELVRAEREAAGYDREAYEHSLSLKDVLNSQSTVLYDDDGEKWFVFRLGGLLGSAEKVKEIAELDEMPKTRWGTNEMGMVQFCWVNEESKKKIDSWIEGKRVL